MEITGKIKKIMNIHNVNDKFKKREFVLTIDYNTPYPQHVLFQTTQEKCSLLDNLRENDEAKVFFNIRGREWTNPENQVKYFVSLEAWRIYKLIQANVDDDDDEMDKLLNEIESDGSSQQPSVSEDKQNDDVNQIDDDGLPF